MIWLFLAGLLSEALVTGQTLAIAKRKAAIAGGLAFLAWGLWGLVLGKIVTDGWNILPFALGAAAGTVAVCLWRRPTAVS